MKEHEPNWFSILEQQLPKQEELIPITQTLIPPNLAKAFNITTPQQQQQPDPGGDDPTRTQKRRPRIVWTPQLHKRFVDAVAYLGFNNAVPKTVMQLMNVDGLTRENVASHMQKYRQYLKRMESGHVDPVTDQLFASSQVPPNVLQQCKLNLQRDIGSAHLDKQQ